MTFVLRDLSIARWTAALIVVVCLTMGSRSATAGIVDPVGDFLGTYTGPQNGDLDVVSTDVTYNGSIFTFTATMNGAIGTTPNAQYVFGVDRGQGTARFAANLGLTGVLFDAVVVLAPSGGTVRDLISNATTFTLAAGDITISGNTITASVPQSALVSEGFTAPNYTVNLWPRLVGGPVANIADFAPDNSNFRVRSVPEPTSLAMLGLGGIALGLRSVSQRRRRPVS